ncbi:MAG: RHS repeat-associated core domain-containing protein [Gemmataceae bacterium]
MGDPLGRTIRWWVNRVLTRVRRPARTVRIRPSVDPLEQRRVAGDVLWSVAGLFDLAPLGPLTGPAHLAVAAAPAAHTPSASPPLTWPGPPDEPASTPSGPADSGPDPDPASAQAAGLMDDFWAGYDPAVAVIAPGARTDTADASAVVDLPQPVQFVSAASGEPTAADPGWVGFQSGGTFGVTSFGMSGGGSGGSGGSGTTVRVRAIDPTASEFGVATSNTGDKLSQSTGAFYFSRSDSASGGATTVTVKYEVLTSSTATPGTDYKALIGTVDLPPGQRGVSVLVEPYVDGVIGETTEAVDIRILPDPSYAVDPYASTATVSISDYGPTKVGILADDPAVREEGGDAAKYTVYRDGDLSNPLTVGLTFTSPGGRVAPPPATVTIAALSRSTSFQLSGVDDPDPQHFGEFYVGIAPGPDYQVLGWAPSAVGYVFDNDYQSPGSGGGTKVLSTLTSDAPVATEGGAPGRFTFTAANHPPEGFPYFSGGAKEKIDYWLDLPPDTTRLDLGNGMADLVGPSPLTVALVPVDDTSGGPDRFAVFELASGHFAGAGQPHDTVIRIVDDDPPVVAIEVSDANSSEPGKISNGGYRVSRTSGPLDRPVTVKFKAAGTATPGADYSSLPGVTIPAGRVSVPLLVVPKDDDIPEPSESVDLTVASPVFLPPPPSGGGGSGGNPSGGGGGSPPPPPARVMIHDDDPLKVYRLTWDPADGMAAEQTGNVQARYPLDLDRSPGRTQAGTPDLVYNSDFARPRPILHVVVPDDPGRGLPLTYKVQVQWDQGGYGKVWEFGPANQKAGDGKSATLGVRADQPVVGTGRHRWDIKLTVDNPAPAVDPTYNETGYEFVEDLTDSPLGSGWSFSATDRLYDIPAAGGQPAGQLRVWGTGSWRFYKDAGGGTFTRPDGDHGTLTRSGGGFQYVTPDGDRRVFNAGGLQTSWASYDGTQQLAYRYADADGDGAVDDLVGTTAIDGAVATCTYTGGHLSGAATATRSYTFGGGARLTSTATPGTATVGYEYDPLTDRLTREQSLDYFTTYAYRYGTVWQAARGGLVTTVYDPADLHGLPLEPTPLPPGLDAPPAALDPQPAGPEKLTGPFTPALGEPVGRVANAYWDRADWKLDRQGRPLDQMAPDGGHRYWEWDAGWLGAFTDEVATPDGTQVRDTEYVRDGVGYVTSEVLPDGNTRGYAYYGSPHRLKTSTDERGKVTTYTYDTSWRLEGVIDPLGNTTIRAWGADGLLASVTDAAGVVTTFAYDGFRRQTRQVEAFGDSKLERTTSFTYDPATGEVETVKVPQGKDAGGTLVALTTSYGYDAGGRREKVTEAVGTAQQRTTVTAYDGAGYVLSVAAPAGSGAGGGTVTTSYAYDKAGQQTRAIEAFGDAKLARTTTTAYDKAGRVQTVTDPLGVDTGFQYDTAGRTVATTEAKGKPLARTTTQTYSSAAEVYRVNDPLGRETRYRYDVIGRPDRTVEAAGTADERRTAMAYFPTGELKTVTTGLAGGQDYAHPSTTDYDIDDAGRTALVKLAAGTAVERDTKYKFDKVGHVIWEYRGSPDDVAVVGSGSQGATNAQFQATEVTSYTYDALGRLTAVYEAAHLSAANATAWLGHAAPVTRYDYDLADNLTGTTDPLLVRTSYSYDALNRRTETLEAWDWGYAVQPTAGPRRTQAEYDAVDHLVTVTDPRNTTTTTAYDVLGRVTAVTEAANRAEARTTGYEYYDQSDRLKAVVDPLAHRTTYTYDDLGRVVTMTDPTGRTWTTKYDAADNPTESIDPLTRTTTVGYDKLDRPVTVRDPLGHVATTVYDAADNPVKAIDPRGFATARRFDAMNQVVSVADPLGHTTRLGYDALGRGVSVTDPLGQATGTAFDPLGRPRRVTDPLTHTTATSYDPLGRPVAVTDALTHTTTTTYDALGQAVATRDARDAVTTVVYDAAGNRTGVIDPAGNRTTFTYDYLNQPETRVDPLTKVTTYKFDQAGRPDYTVDRLGRKRDFTYDDAGRLTGEEWVASGGGTVAVSTYGYTTAGQLETAANPAGAYTLSYDTVGRIQTVAEPYGLSLTFTYDDAGNRLTAQDNKGGTVTSEYDAAGRLASRRLTGAGAVVRADFTYSDRDQLTGVTRSADLFGGGSVGTTSYTYDDAGRLGAITHRDPTGAVLASYTYGYDIADRLETESASGVSITHAYDDANQLKVGGGVLYDPAGTRSGGGSVPGPANRLASDGTWAYGYDDEGNVVKRSKGASADTWAYGYDFQDRLVTAAYSPTDGGPVTARVTYTYDALGNRSSRSEWQSGGGTTVEKYAYDGWDTAKPGAVGTEAFDAWADLDADGNLAARRVFGGGVDQPLARVAAGQAGWYLTDARGSVRAVTDGSGAVTGTRDYAPFGAVTATAGAGLDRYAWTGREWDSALGLEYNRARVYDPGAGRWLSEDPAGFAAGDPNLYRYAGNSPTNATDPSGLQPPPRANWIDEWKDYQAPWWTGWVGRRVEDVAYYGVARPVDRVVFEPVKMATDLKRSAVWYLDHELLGTNVVYAPGEQPDYRSRVAVLNLGVGQAYAEGLGEPALVLGGGKVVGWGAQGLRYVGGRLVLRPPAGEPLPADWTAFGQPPLFPAPPPGGGVLAPKPVAAVPPELIDGSAASRSLTVEPVRPPAPRAGAPKFRVVQPGEAVNIGRGDALQHFTDAKGVAGITGIPEDVLAGLKPGQQVVVDAAHFKPGVNPYLSGEGGGVGVTKAKLGEMTPHEIELHLKTAGVPPDRRGFAIEFSQETVVQNGIQLRADSPAKSIWSLPGETILKGTITIKKVH